MKRTSDIQIWAGLVFVAIGTIGLVGWIMNIFKLVDLAQATDPNYIMAVLRAVGIFFAPLGAILGLFF